MKKSQAGVNVEGASNNGKIVTFTNTVAGMYRLTTGEVDMFFGATPSKEQINDAKARGIEFDITPIGKEAFVFFVEADNPVSNLYSDDIKQIYHGNIVNWAEVGGINQNIKAFQRPEGSGSQTMMEYFMDNIDLKKTRNL